MKRIWVAVCLGMGLAGGLAQANLLLNPGVENGLSNVDITDWTRVNNVYREDATAWGITDGDPIYEGTYAAKMFGGDAEMFQANLSVVAGSTYVSGGWFYHSASEDVIAPAADSMRMFLHVEWFDAGNGLVGQDYSANHNGLLPGDTWGFIGMTNVAPLGADHATFHVEADQDTGGGSMFGDAFSFDVIPEPTSLSLLGLAVCVLSVSRKLRPDV